MTTQSAGDPKLDFVASMSHLPVSHLESLRFKCNQIIESITALQRTIEYGGMAAMPAWPDILSKYNILLSQTHNFSSSLLPVLASGNLYEKIAIHPNGPMTDAQLDNEVIPLLRNQQTTDVLRMESETVRRLAERMETKGSIGVLSTQPPMRPKPEYADVLKECASIREEHDRRVERAVRAVGMLRERFEWKARVEVEVEEPEELQWDPRLANGGHDEDVDMDDGGSGGTPSATSDDEVQDTLNNESPEEAEGSTPAMFDAGTPLEGRTPDVLTPSATQFAAELEGMVDEAPTN